MKVWVELGENGGAARIFRTRKAVSQWLNIQGPHPGNKVAVVMDRATAVGQIRRKVWERDGGCCVKCGHTLLWASGFAHSMEMDEIQAKGKCVRDEDGQYRSGEVSVMNCQSLCRGCHGKKHDRVPKFSKPGTVSDDKQV